MTCCPKWCLCGHAVRTIPQTGTIIGKAQKTKKIVVKELLKLSLENIMAKKIINIGKSANKGDGDSLRTAFSKK